MRQGAARCSDIYVFMYVYPRPLLAATGMCCVIENGILHYKRTPLAPHPASQPTNQPAELCQSKSSPVKLYHCAAPAAAERILFTSFDLTRMRWVLGDER